MTLLVDDHVLSAVLRGDGLPAPVDSDPIIATTGYWYVRLCQAVLGVADRPGTLSRPFMALSSGRREQALGAVLELPEEIGLVSLRELGPVIGLLRARHQLNILSAEAVAAAVHLNATVALSARSPRLEEALRAEGMSFHIVASMP
ncbi:MAG TPA: hypothetical protein VM262_18120 [Acidimicrobiales bacterium]|nr:hypothetical protein [Acidimicrobiales bacterium]